MPYLARWIGLSFLALSTSLSAQIDKNVREIVIHSGWGGLGTPQHSTVRILGTRDGFERDNKPINPALVQAFLSAVQAPPISKPDPANLGITKSWLQAELGTVEAGRQSEMQEATARQKALFETTFTDPEKIALILPNLFAYSSSDDYPHAEVKITFSDDSQLTLASRSYYEFMLPWTRVSDNTETYNAEVSRAVAALLPPKSTNKERLDGPEFALHLAEAVMSSIEQQWKLIGAEDRAGDSLAKLRARYTITASDINPYHDAEFGVSWDPKGPHETNLHVTLHRPVFPPNLAVEGIFLSQDGRVEGIDQFLKTGSRYEELTLSVRWLMDWLREHPDSHAYLFNVHGLSFGEHALQIFSKDMKLRERNDLVEKVRAQQSRIALLKVDGADWLIFPDRHLLLWRYEWSGLLKWRQENFGEGECADYRVNDGGCSGREVSADGVLIPDRTPRDMECLKSWRSQHPTSSSPTNALFEVEEHGREGFIGRTGEIVIPLCYEAAGEFSEGLARFERDGRWGYIDSTGSIVIQPTFPWAEEFHDGLAHVQVSGTVLGYDGRWGYIDQTGKIIIPPSAGRMFSDSSGEESAFHEGLAVIEVEGEAVPPRRGFIDKSGKLVIPARFTYVFPFSEGLAAATESESGDTGWGYIDRSGNWAIPPSFAWASSFQFGLAPVDRKKDCGYIDKNGNLVLRLPAPGGKQECAVAWGDFTDGLSRWLFGKQYGFIDRGGKTVIPPQFDLTYGFSEGLAAVQIGKQWGYIDTTGKMTIGLQELKSAKPFHNGLAEVQTIDGSWGYIERSGKYVWGPHQRNDAKK